ncbi:MAG: nucleotidyltransferase domain-containing protein [Methanolobus sp.]|nr:nucleotidyltransferase domain-containing protein [Methanolobus sp.]
MPENSSVFESSLKQVKEAVLEAFAYEDVRVILFGSRARGDSGRTSDIDVGILPRGPYNRRKLTVLREKLEDMNIPYTVDVVDISEVSDDFRRKVLEEGIVWKN